MQLTRLCIQSVRNLKESTLLFHPRFNFIMGNNGSGKTSLLEAIYLLAMGRSFRSRQIQPVITHGASTLACFGEVVHLNQVKTTLGIEKNREGEVHCKIQGERCARLSDLASILPIQLVTPDTFRLLVAGAEERRRFIDWGVFHVEPHFATLCQSYHRALKQRNVALKQSHVKEKEGVGHWEALLVHAGEAISRLRAHYVEDLIPFIQAACTAWLPDIPIEMAYFPGWKEGTLEEAMVASRGRDAHLGYTSVGPHRAELFIRVTGEAMAHQVLSRGQQKLFIFACYSAQAQQLRKRTEKQSLFLIDDLASELDNDNREKIMAALWEQEYQVFCTAIEPIGDRLTASMNKMFHVEHGEIS